MSAQATPSATQAEVVLVGCGVPLRGMGWYHAVQMLKEKVPCAKLCHVVEPWFMGAGMYTLFSNPIQVCAHLCILANHRGDGTRWC